MNIIIHLGAELAASIEMIELPFCDRTQELLKSGKVIVACDTSVKKWCNEVMLGYDEKRERRVNKP